MSFPFLPGGAILAVFALGTVLAAFGLTLRFLDRAALEVKSSIVPGVVSGLREWADGHRMPSLVVSAASPSSSPATGAVIEDQGAEPGLQLERVVRRLR
jgi:hypothetical protein